MVTPIAVATGVVLTLGGVLGLGIAYVALRHRDHPAAGPLAGISGLPGLAGLCFGALVAVPDSSATRPLLVASYVLLILTVGYFLLFSLAYTGRREWLTQRRRRGVLGFFGVLAAIDGFDVFTKPISVRTVNGLTFPVLPTRTEGPVFLFSAVVVYLTVFVGVGILTRFLISDRNMYRKQTALIVGAIGTTVVAGIVYEAGLRFHPGLNLISVLYSVEALVIAVALFRYEFLNVEPFAPEVVLERIDDPVLVLEETDTIVDTNPAARRLVDSSDPVGTPVHDLLPGLMQAAAKDEEYVPPGTESESAGHVEVYDLNAAPISDQYDRERGTVVVLRDVSVQKQRERTLERLQSVSQRFLVAESADDVLEIAVTAAEELLGYPYSGAMVYDDEAEVLRPAAVADPLEDAFEEGPSAIEPIVRPGSSDVWQVFESGEPILGDPIDPSDGVELPVEVGGSLLYPLGDHGVFGISAGPDHEAFSDDDRRFADILASATENALDRVEKERQLRESRELLATRTEQIEFFNGVLRHDLLNGIQVIQGRIERLSDQVDGEAGDHVAVIDDWIDDIVGLTRNVRAVTGVVSEEGTAELTAVDLGTALSEKVRKVREGYDSVTVDVVVDLDRLPAVRADEFLQEVFENLLVNAVEHNDRDHTEIVVDVVVKADTVTVQIADDGPGIDNEDKEEIFEKSVTSADSGSIGFGLYFVRIMLDRYGGAVWVKDRAEWSPSETRHDRDDDRGTVAVVELPIAGRDDVAGRGASTRDNVPQRQPE